MYSFSGINIQSLFVRTFRYRKVIVAILLYWWIAKTVDQ